MLSSSLSSSAQAAKARVTVASKRVKKAGSFTAHFLRHPPVGLKTSLVCIIIYFALSFVFRAVLMTGG